MESSLEGRLANENFQYSLLQPSTSAMPDHTDPFAVGTSHSEPRSRFSSTNTSDMSCNFFRSTPPEQNWARCLENVLEDGDGLALFKTWMQQPGNGTDRPILLHYAIRAFRAKLNDCYALAGQEHSHAEFEKLRMLVTQIYQRFIKPTSDGTEYCSFIHEQVRQSVRKNVKDMHAAVTGGNSTALPAHDVFDECDREVLNFLRMQHASFVQSQDFIDVLNRALNTGDTSQSDGSANASRSSSRSSHYRDEQTMLGDRVEDLTINMNSAQISNNTAGSLTTTAQAPPLPPRHVSPYKKAPPPLPPPVHSSSKKHKKQLSAAHQQQKMLTAEMLRSTQKDRGNSLGMSQVEKLFPSGVQQKPYVCAATTSKNDSAVSSAFSSEASGQHGQNRRSTGGKVLNSRQIKKQQQQINPPGQLIPRNEFLTKQEPSDDHMSPQGRFDFYKKVTCKLEELKQNRLKEADVQKTLSDIGTKRRDARTAISDLKHRDDDEDEVIDAYVNRWKQDDSSKPSPGSQRSPGGFLNAILPFMSRRRSPKSTSPERRMAAISQHSQYMPCSTTNQMSASMHGFPYGYQGGFAPPPRGQQPSSAAAPQSSNRGGSGLHFQPPPLPSGSNGHGKTSSLHGSKRYDARPGLAVSDTSGIESGVSSTFTPAPNPLLPDASRRAFDKLKQQGQQQQQHQTGTQKRQKPSAAQQQASPQNYNSLPRMSGASHRGYTANAANRSSNRASETGELTIGYCRENESAPYVQKVEACAMTLKQFKHHFVLRGKKIENTQFFFKSPSDDPDIPYEMLLVTDDAATLPIFDGKIMAQLKSTTDSD